MIRTPHRTGSAILLASCFVLWSTARPAWADTSEATPLATHHATYKLSLLRSNGTNAPASVAGFIDYDFSGSTCEGFATSFRQMTELQPAEGEARLNDMNSTTFEDGSGDQFTFSTKSSMDRTVVTDLDGKASRSGAGDLSVELRRPPASFKSGSDILFPTEHLRKIIATARAGGKLLTASVYDGSDTGKKVYRTLSVIGAPIDKAPDDAAGKNAVLRSLRRWPVAISYFDGDAADHPDYVLSFDLYENGVSRALRLDYGDFILAGELDDLRLSSPAACAAH